MSWTSTLVIAHAPAESPLELRSVLLQEGRRCLTWAPGGETPAGLKDADAVIAMPGLVASASGKDAPFKRSATGRALVLALAAATTPWADAVVHPQTAMRPITDRVGALLRLTILEREVELRSKTFEALGNGALDDRGLNSPPTIRALHIGGPSPEFPHLQDTLAKFQIELRPVLRASLALDEIENGLVDAVVLDATVSAQTVRELSIILRRNSDLALWPVVVLDPRGSGEPAARAPSLISDVVRAKHDPELVAMRLRQLVTETRRRRRAIELLKRARTKGRYDVRTSLSTLPLLEAHLQTHLAESAATGRALSVGHLHFQARDFAPAAIELQSISEQVASLIARLIRAEDMAAQTSQMSIAFLFPATIETAAQAALKRNAAVIGATRFHSPRTAEGVAVDVDWTVTQPRAGQSPSELWGLAADAQDRTGA